MNILVINAGSSSLKYQLLNPETGALLAKGLCERIGIDRKFTYKPQVEGKQVLDAVDVAMPTHSEAIQAVLDALDRAGILGGLPVEGGILWCVTELVSREELDRAVAIIREVC